MSATVAVIVALPRELEGLVRGLKPDASLVREGIFLYRTERTLFVAAGMGAARVSVAFGKALAEAQIREVISVGLAGACLPDVLPGSAQEASVVIDAPTGERYRTAFTGGTSVLVSETGITSGDGKARLAATYGAAMVDMEAATLARLAAAHGLGFRALKGISDGPGFDMSFLDGFAGKRGEFRTAAFALYAMARPGLWSQVAALMRNSKQALQAVTAMTRGYLKDSAAAE